MTEPLLTSRAAAELLSCSPRTLWSLTKSGELPAIRVGKRAVRYSMDDLMAYVQKQKTVAAA